MTHNHPTAGTGEATVDLGGTAGGVWSGNTCDRSGRYAGNARRRRRTSALHAAFLTTSVQGLCEQPWKSSGGGKSLGRVALPVLLGGSPLPQDQPVPVRRGRRCAWVRGV
jgi:hypothetical protein